ncbi:MAG: hypothetical protein ACI9RY_000884 [Reinekea sp.]|jgi:hypothetical protein
MKIAVVALALFAALPALASPGAVDEYDCHRDTQSRDYHCHGSVADAKQSHLLIGGQFSGDQWLWDNGPGNLFAGAAVAGEWAVDSIAVRGNYSYGVHLNGNHGFALSGWDLNIKVGSGLARLGNHLFAQAGYANRRFIFPDSSAKPFDGFQMGVGWVRVMEKFAVDAVLLYQDPTALEQIWDDLNFPGKLTSYRASLGVYRRF